MASKEHVARAEQLLGLSALPVADDETSRVPMLDTQVGRRVAAARRRAGLEAADVAAQVGLTPDKLSKIETGRRRVAPRELPALARALGVSMTSLLSPADTSRPALALAHRVAAGAPAGATSNARRRAVELLEAEDRLSQRAALPPRQLSPAGAAVGQLVSQQYSTTPRTKPEAGRQGRALAEEVRRHLELGVSEIGDLPSLVEMHFAADVAMSPLSEGSDGLCAHEGDAALLVVNTDCPQGRTRFTLAHELGHHLLNDVRAVIEESQHDMHAGNYIERRVNSFAAHLLLPVKAIAATIGWLGATPQDITGATARGQVAIGYLMVRYGVSLPCTLGQLVDAGYLSLAGKNKFAAELRAGDLVRAAAPLHTELDGPERTVRERRPPARLATVVLEAARSGAVGMNTVSAVLDRPNDEELFDEVMFGALAPAAPATLSAPLALRHLIHTTPLGSRYYYPHFNDVKTEAQRS